MLLKKLHPRTQNTLSVIISLTEVQARAATKLDRRDDGYIRLSVADDGSGCPEEVTPGMGTQLLRALVREHKGTYERRNLEKGSEVVVSFAPRQDWPPRENRAPAL